MNIQNSMLNYRVQFANATEHFVKVSFSISLEHLRKHFGQDLGSLTIYLPVWSPGSYLVREYARHVRHLQAELAPTGEALSAIKKTKNTWEVNLRPTLLLKTNLAAKDERELVISYEVYAFELTVRTSYVTSEFAFLQGPSVFMTIMGLESFPIGIELYPRSEWSSVTTSLTLLEVKENKMSYSAQDYDELLDSPIQLGCHEVETFFSGTTHIVSFQGKNSLLKENFLKDLSLLCQTIQQYFDDVPFSHYTFMLHFFPQIYGGLEHASSSVNQFDGRFLHQRSEYLKFLGLLSHEYIHAWNVKRLRPIELGPFNYQGENYTRMLWLAEGLTQYLDDYFLYLSGLMTEKEYAEVFIQSINQYFKTPGRKHDPIEESSFDAWIKHYRPHGQLGNMTVSYYLKGQILLFSLSLLMQDAGFDVHAFIKKLWKTSTTHPKRGVTKEEVLTLLAEHSNQKIADQFDEWLVTTQDPPLAQLLEKQGYLPIWSSNALSFQVEFDQQVERLIVSTTWEGGSFFEKGIAPGDELIAVDGQRILKNDWKKFEATLRENHFYHFLFARESTLFSIEVMPKAQGSTLLGLQLPKMPATAKK